MIDIVHSKIMLKIFFSGYFLCINLEIRHHDRYLRAGNYQNDENQEQKSKKIIKFIFPNCFFYISKNVIFHKLMSHLMS